MFKWLRQLGSTISVRDTRAGRLRFWTAGGLRARYDAAQTTPENRRHWLHADELSADAAANPQVRRTLRARARYEVANNSYAKGIVHTLANFVIGTGPRLQMLLSDGGANELIEREFQAWSTAVCLADRLRTLRISQSESGEAFALLTRNTALGARVQLDLRLVEADQVASPLSFASMVMGNRREIDGVLLDADGNVIGYRLLQRHPGDAAVIQGRGTSDIIPANAMIHLYRVDRPGQHRGVPEITPALPLFALLRRYTLAVLGSAEQAALPSGVIYTDGPADSDVSDVEPLEQVEMDRGTWLTMPFGWKIGQLRAEQPTTVYADFKHEVLNEIARCLHMPFNIAAGNSSGYNYASGQLDHQAFFKSIRVEQSHLGRVVLDRILRAWLDEAVLLEDYLPESVRTLDAAFPHQWFWDGLEHVDPVKHANAQRIRLDGNLTTLATEFARQGQDWETELRQRARERALMRELGLSEPGATDAGEAEPDDEEREAQAGTGTMLTAAAPPEPESFALIGDVAIDLVAQGEEGAPAERPRFRILAYTGGALNVQGFFRQVVIDLSGLRARQDVPVLLDHASDQIVGQARRVQIEGDRVSLEGIITGDDEPAKRVLMHARNGFGWSASVGVNIERMQVIEAHEQVSVNGRSFRGPILVVRQGRLAEVSFVGSGADENASVSVAAASTGVAEMEFNTWLKAKGFDPKGLTEAQRATLEAAYDAERKLPAEPATGTSGDGKPAVSVSRDSKAEDAAIRAQERRRYASIEALCKPPEGGWGPNQQQVDTLRASAIAGDLTVEGLSAKLVALLRESRPTAPAVHTGTTDVTAAALEASLVATYRVLPEKRIGEVYGERVAEAARGPELRGASLADLFHQVIRAAGLHTRSGRVTNETIRTAFEADRKLRAAGDFSTLSLPGILSNVANKALLERFAALESVVPQIAYETDTSDFKPFTRYRLDSDGSFKEIAQDGELKHVGLVESEFSNQLQTHGGLMTLTRRMIVDDNLGAFLQIPAIFAELAIHAREEMVFKTILANTGSFFSTGNGNYIEGADTVLSIDAVNLARQSFREQRTAGGKFILISPRRLLVPPAVEAMARRLFTAETVNETTAEGEASPASNPHRGLYEPIVSPYLSAASGLTSASDTAWYLLAAPTAGVAIVQVGYLQGMRTPVIESGQTDFDTLGIRWRGYFDFGTALHERRAGVLSKGAV